MYEKRSIRMLQGSICMRALIASLRQKLQRTSLSLGYCQLQTVAVWVRAHEGEGRRGREKNAFEFNKTPTLCDSIRTRTSAYVPLVPVSSIYPQTLQEHSYISKHTPRTYSPPVNPSKPPPTPSTPQPTPNYSPPISTPYSPLPSLPLPSPPLNLAPPTPPSSFLALSTSFTASSTTSPPTFQVLSSTPLSSNTSLALPHLRLQSSSFLLTGGAGSLISSPLLSPFQVLLMRLLAYWAAATG